ncbi:hypothetical protein NBRC116583_07900 [Arenicella sp. 4NH20-0111]|uniref:hypothetical protein n=1 Tax=Arenicella sp. 4NH20-0111 TaxID=3127648 RepID=UPI0031030D26
MNDVDLIKAHLVGDFVTSFSVGSTGWSIQFSECEYVLLAQNLASPVEALLNELYQKNFPVVSKTADKGDVAKSTIMSCCLRQKIRDIKLDTKKNLEINYENDISITCPTDMDMVDWQWSFTRDGKCPYTTNTLLIGCLWQGEIERGKTS